MRLRLKAYLSLGDNGPAPFELVVDAPEGTPTPAHGDMLELKPDLRVKVLGRVLHVDADGNETDVELAVVPTGVTVVLFDGADKALEAAGFTKRSD